MRQSQRIYRHFPDNQFSRIDLFWVFLFPFFFLFFFFFFFFFLFMFLCSLRDTRCDTLNISARGLISDVA